jgi:hypothetical protein
MALGDLTKQLAQQALLSATSKDPAPAPQPEGLAATMLAEIARMQKALKEDEELLVYFQSGAERIRVMEIFMASRQLAILSGTDAERRTSRVVAPVETLQLVCKVAKAAPGIKGVRVNLVTRKSAE